MAEPHGSDPWQSTMAEPHGSDPWQSTMAAPITILSTDEMHPAFPCAHLSACQQCNIRTCHRGNSSAAARISISINVATAISVSALPTACASHSTPAHRLRVGRCTGAPAWQRQRRSSRQHRPSPRPAAEAAPAGAPEHTPHSLRPQRQADRWHWHCHWHGRCWHRACGCWLRRNGGPLRHCERQQRTAQPRGAASDCHGVEGCAGRCRWRGSATTKTTKHKDEAIRKYTFHVWSGMAWLCPAWLVWQGVA